MKPSKTKLLQNNICLLSCPTTCI